MAGPIIRIDPWITKSKSQHQTMLRPRLQKLSTQGPTGWTMLDVVEGYRFCQGYLWQTLAVMLMYAARV